MDKTNKHIKVFIGRGFQNYTQPTVQYVYHMYSSMVLINVLLI